VSDTLTDHGITACRHGNGRDWWLMASEGGNNCYYTLLYNPDTIQVVERQCIGVKSQYLDGGQSLFSPDGSMFIRGSIIDGVEIFDFDRCSGLLSNARQIPLSVLQLGSTNIVNGTVAVSPNSKYLYMFSSARILQFDLESNELLASQILIHNSDTAVVQNYGFATAQIAPNGEIFISGSSQPKIHIIHNPNEQGTACNLEVSIPLPKGGSFGLPNFPNYRLGALTGSPCDTLGVGIRELGTQIELLVYPNPAHNYVEVDYGFFPWQSKSEASLSVKNMLGEEVLFLKLPQYSAKQILNIKELASGVYFINLMDGGVVVGSEKLLIR